MADPYIGEIKIVSFDYAPRGYAQCDGQILPINQNQPLFSILGTTYGGNGQTNFALPDLRNSVPIHPGSGINLGTKSGEQAHTLITNEIPAHNHQLNASQQGAAAATPVSYYLPTLSTAVYAPLNTLNTAMVNNEVSNTGGNQAHENMQPYLVLNIIIALTGIFPPRN
jgi:microcystin-dependent protein